MGRVTDMPPFMKALGHRNYRIFFCGVVVSQTGVWMQTIAMSWLTYRLTGSVFMLGLVGFASQIPVLFLAPIGGLLADRFNRRKLIMATQSVALCQAATLATLTLGGWIEPWHLVALSLLLGTIYAVDTPVRQSMAIRVIDDPRDLGNAITWNGLSFNLSRLVGPAIGGLVVAAYGEGVSFLLNVVTYAIAIGFMRSMRLKDAPARPSMGGGLAAGFRYAFGTPVMRIMMLMTSAIALGTLPYTVLLPYFAKNVFGGDADTLGLLTSAMSVGGISAALYALSRRTVPRVPRVVSNWAIILGVALLILPHMPSLGLAMVPIAFVGAGIFLIGNGTTTMVQTLVPDEVRGRMISIFTMGWFGLVPVGSFIAGVLADRIGPEHVVGLCGVVSVVCGILYRRAFPVFRQVFKEAGLDGPPR